MSSITDSPLPEYAALARLWALRMIVLCGGHTKLLSATSCTDENLLRSLGLEHLVKGQDYDAARILNGLREALTEAEASVLPPLADVIERNLAQIAAFVGLNATDVAILRLRILSEHIIPLSDALDLVDSLGLTRLAQIASGVLQLPRQDVLAALDEDGTLANSGLLSVDLCGFFGFNSKIDLMDELCERILFEESHPLQLFGSTMRQGDPARLRADNYPHLQGDITNLRAYLAQTQQQKQRGVNILIHGTPGSGKTEFVRMLAELIHRPLYEIATERRNGRPLPSNQRLRSYQLAQRFLRGNEGALILFDEIEDVFTESIQTDQPRQNQSGTKAWMNRQLESNPTPTFWLSNQIAMLDPAYLRRFDYVLELNAPPRRVRERIVSDYLGELPVSAGFRQRIASIEALTPAVVERVCKVTALVNQADPTIPVETTLGRVLGNTLEALELPPLPRSVGNPVGEYRLDVLNADCDLPTLCASLRETAEARLCLYGPPGTGKSAFGRYLAEALDRPLLVKRASDLRSKWLGETEKNMARMFAEARDEGAVLLLDEADSFLLGREGARQSWEVSHVNEMLTQMESFDGLFVASTNFMTAIDSAALRRFDLKIRFDCLKADQAWQLFGDLCAKLQLATDEALRAPLARLTNLTPGDFANVARQTRLTRLCSAADLLARLQAECRVKPAQESRPIGFCA